MKPELIFDAKAELAEGPTWDEKTQTLYWLDILGKRIHAGMDLVAQLDDFIGCLALRQDGNLIFGKRASLLDLNLSTSQQSVLASVSEVATNRINDGKCDPTGRFIFGTMDIAEEAASGFVYSFDGRQITRLMEGIRISNGLTWSPDGKTFYYIDTPTREVKAFDYDLGTGQIANQRIAIRVPDGMGWPDGMTSDMEGNLWIAMWGGAQVTRWNPNTGQLLEQIPVPALLTSSCIFGGKDRNELYITSARKALSDVELQKYPLSGGIFKVTTKFEGMPTFRFG
ncbi:MAG: SMP-30/gluconolactonase/LRE family protein [Anaerolineales bacterium]|nr:SMP-30/gluconolactonase/LRE family protein [Anaerolineales bacterium]